MSARAPAKPPQKGPKSDAVTNTGMNLKAILIALPTLKVAYMPKSTVRAMRSEIVQRSRTELMRTYGRMPKAEQRMPSKRVSKNILMKNERSSEKLAKEDENTIFSEMSDLKSAEYSSAPKSSAINTNAKTDETFFREKSPVLCPKKRAKTITARVLSTKIKTSDIKNPLFFHRGAVTKISFVVTADEKIAPQAARLFVQRLYSHSLTLNAHFLLCT